MSADLMRLSADEMNEEHTEGNLFPALPREEPSILALHLLRPTGRLFLKKDFVFSRILPKEALDPSPLRGMAADYREVVFPDRSFLKAERELLKSRERLSEEEKTRGISIQTICGPGSEACELLSPELPLFHEIGEAELIY